MVQKAAKETIKVSKQTIRTLRDNGIVDSCTGCGQPHAIYWPQWDDFYCPKCYKGHMLYVTAEEQLQDLIKERVIPVWVNHWRTLGLDNEAFKSILREFPYMANFEEMNFGDEELKQVA